MDASAAAPPGSELVAAKGTARQSRTVRTFSG
jgi:hypothetical protein